MILTKLPFKNLDGNKTNVGNQEFFFFPKYFLFYQRQMFHNLCLSKSSAKSNAFNLDKSKILPFGKELYMYMYVYLQCLQHQKRWISHQLFRDHKWLQKKKGELNKTTLTYYQTKTFRLFQTERVLQPTISNLTKMAESYPNG